MTTQHHTSFTQSIFGSAQRLFRSKKNNGLLAPAHIDARTARDIEHFEAKPVHILRLESS